MNVVRRLTLRDSDSVRTGGNHCAYVFLPVRSIEAVDSHDDLRLAVIDVLDGVVERESRCVLLVLGDGVLEVEDN